MLARIFNESWEWALLIARIVLGVIFITQGYTKLFVMGIDGFAGFLENQAQIPLPYFFAWVVSLTEFLGGIAVLLGIFTRWAALGLAVVMVVAVFTVTSKMGLLGPDGVSGYQLNLAYLALSLSLLFAGPGRLALEKSLLNREI